MSIKFHPRAGQILVCDFTGFVPPEMVKIRPVVIISPRLPYRDDLVALVPISTSSPRHGLPFVVKLSKNYHPLEDDAKDCWAKCDMVMNLSTQRLNGFKIGKRKWDYPHMSGEDLQAVRQGVLFGLGLNKLKI